MKSSNGVQANRLRTWSARANWIKTHPTASADEVATLRASHALGTGELATILLGRKLKSDLAIVDERSARRLAQANGLAVMGCVGILETGHRRGLMEDLRHVYQQLTEKLFRCPFQTRGSPPCYGWPVEFLTIALQGERSNVHGVRWFVYSQ